MRENNIWSEQDELNKRKKKKRNIYIIIAVIIFIILSLSAFLVLTNKKVKSWENKIYNGITINGIDVSGKTKEEAKLLISADLIDKVDDKSITIKSKNENVVVPYEKIKPQYKIDDAINEALSSGKNEGLFSKNSYINKGMNKNIEVLFGYDNEVMATYLNELNEKIMVEPQNAKLKINGDKIEVIAQKNGLELDLDASKKLLNEEIDCNIDVMKETLELPTKEKIAKVTEEVLGQIDTKLSSSSTNFNSGDWNRTTNLKIATGNINGTVLLPGEEFSYNEVVGERTVDRGFKEGASFVGGEVVPSIGGGVCQISTTLYQAVTKSGILPTERSNHTMAVSYADPSEDATVAWGYLDYKFKNTYDSPIYIEGIITDGTVTFNVYGDGEDLNGYTYDLVGVLTGTTNPGSKRINDSSLSKGTEVVEKRPSIGRTSKGYFVTYKDGEEVERKEISSDIYDSVQGVIRYGTGS